MTNEVPRRNPSGTVDEVGEVVEAEAWSPQRYEVLDLSRG